MSTLLNLLVAVLALSCVHSAAPIHRTPDVQRGELKNGLRYVLIRDTDTMVAWGITTGTLEEEDTAGGVAALLPRALAIGTSLEHANIMVGSDTSTVQLDHVDDLLEAVASIRAWLRVPLDPNNVVRIIAKSRFAEADADPAVTARFSGLRLAHGQSRDLRIEEFQRYRDRWYVAHRMTIIVSGSWPFDECLSVLERMLGDVPDHSTPPEPTLVEGPPVRQVGLGTTEGVVVGFRSSQSVPSTLDALRNSIARSLFEAALGARLEKTSSLSDSIDVSEHRLAGALVSIEIRLVTSENKAAAAALLLREVERARTTPFTRKELDAVRDVPANAHANRIDGPALGAEGCANEQRRALLGFLFPRCRDEDREWHRLIPTITDEEIDQYRAMLDVHAATLAVTDRTAAPSAEAVRAAIGW